MELLSIKSKRFKTGDLIETRLSEALSAARLRVKNGDIIAIASKVVSLSEDNVVSLASVKSTARARKMAERFGMNPKFVQVVLEEADHVYAGVHGAILSIKNGNAIANSGVDQKNAPDNRAIPWPVNPQRSARRIRKAITRILRKNLGVIIVDSHVTPLRLGTTGFALACSGFHPVHDFRGVEDLYGRKARITLQALGDGIASAAHLLMGETRESVPFVLVRGAPVSFGNVRGLDPMVIGLEECLFMSQIPRQPS